MIPRRRGNSFVNDNRFLLGRRGPPRIWIAQEDCIQMAEFRRRAAGGAFGYRQVSHSWACSCTREACNCRSCPHEGEGFQIAGTSEFSAASGCGPPPNGRAVGALFHTSN